MLIPPARTENGTAYVKSPKAFTEQTACGNCVWRTELSAKDPAAATSIHNAFSQKAASSVHRASRWWPISARDSVTANPSALKNEDPSSRTHQIQSASTDAAACQQTVPLPQSAVSRILQTESEFGKACHVPVCGLRPSTTATILWLPLPLLNGSQTVVKLKPLTATFGPINVRLVPPEGTHRLRLRTQPFWPKSGIKFATSGPGASFSASRSIVHARSASMLS